MSNDTDDEYQVKAAAQSYKWRWPSDMHNCGTIKTNTKDVMVLLLVLFQKIFRGNHSQRPLTALYGFSVAVSGLLIFFVGSNYWGSTIGFWLMMMYLLSAWPWQTALYGGHIGVATMTFLASVLTIQQLTPGSPNFSILMGVGVLFGCMLFSSGSSIKYIPLFFAALVASKYYVPASNMDALSLILRRLAEGSYAFDAIALLGIGSLFAFLKLTKKQLVDSLYDDALPLIKRLNIIRGQKLFSREYYYRHADKKLPKYFKNFLKIYFGLSVLVHLLGASYLLPFFQGFVLVFLTLTLPDVKLNTKYYLRHVLSAARKTRFEKYMDYFAKRGMKIEADFRAPLLLWLPKLAWRVAPLQTLLLTGIFLLFISSSSNIILKILIIFISLLPILWGEITGGVHSLRTFSPALIGILFFLGFTVVSLDFQYLPPFFAFTVMVIGVQQLWVFFNDVFPSRMTIPNLIDTLDKNNIREFYTYETHYNDALVNAINLERPADKKYKINYINSLSDIEKGWIVIPPTNSKSISMECAPEAMNGDYTRDPKLNELLTTRKIEQLATAKFKTFGSSKIWPQEADVATYMDLILKEIDENQRFKGYAWLVKAEKIKKS